MPKRLPPRLGDLIPAPPCSCEEALRRGWYSRPFPTLERALPQGDLFTALGSRCYGPRPYLDQHHDYGADSPGWSPEISFCLTLCHFWLDFDCFGLRKSILIGRLNKFNVKYLLLGYGSLFFRVLIRLSWRACPRKDKLFGK